ncbi:AMP-binding protein, partial [Bordetella pertussis]
MQPPGHTWWDIIEEHARRFPERDALAHGDGAITYGELAARVRRCAAGLSARGIGAG